jgi:hypothetical protein
MHNYNFYSTALYGTSFLTIPLRQFGMKGRRSAPWDPSIEVHNDAMTPEGEPRRGPPEKEGLFTLPESDSWRLTPHFGCEVGS